jgi:hypothetical protein
MMMTLLSATTVTHKLTAWDQFVEIIGKPDNMPVAGALVLVLLFTVVAMKQALAHDRLIRDGKKDKIIEELQR